MYSDDNRSEFQKKKRYGEDKKPYTSAHFIISVI